MKAGREAEKWRDVTAEMMSDEEKRGDVYVRHRPDYRSDRFNTFIDKLDKRCEEKATSHHARFKRRVGTPLKTPQPQQVKSWMVKELATDNSEQQTEQGATEGESTQSDNEQTGHNGSMPDNGSSDVNSSADSGDDVTDSDTS